MIFFFGMLFFGGRGFVSCFRLRGMQSIRSYIPTHIWIPAELRGACFELSKSLNWFLCQWVACRLPRSMSQGDWQLATIFRVVAPRTGRRTDLGGRRPPTCLGGFDGGVLLTGFKRSSYLCVRNEILRAVLRAFLEAVLGMILGAQCWAWSSEHSGLCA